VSSSWPIDDPAMRDPRAIDELFDAALCEPEDEAWQAITALHWKGSSEVLEHAAQLCRSECSLERCIGADILGQLGVPNRTFPEQSAAVLLQMLAVEQEPEVLQSIFVGLGHLHHCQAIPAAVRFIDHPDPDVRHAVVLALTGHNDPFAVEMLIGLARDSDAYVRDWATFALGMQIDLDTPVIRQVLVDRLTDSDEDARGEALRGLARRRDPRVLAPLAKELAADSLNSFASEAVDMLVGTELHEQLKSLMQR
jgi:HEAT repeat protein